jgi:hypothetical protein
MQLASRTAKNLGLKQLKLRVDRRTTFMNSEQEHVFADFSVTEPEKDQETQPEQHDLKSRSGS